MIHKYKVVFREQNKVRMILSLPTRERGLKLIVDKNGDGTQTVAPYTGAWIEIIPCVR